MNDQTVSSPSNFIARLRKKFADHPAWSWLILALKQDECIWQCLAYTPLGEHAIDTLPARPEEWNPATIAAMPLISPAMGDDNAQNIMPGSSELSGDENVQEKLLQAYQSWRNRDPDSAIANIHLSDKEHHLSDTDHRLSDADHRLSETVHPLSQLVQYGLVARYLKEYAATTRSWCFLRELIQTSGMRMGSGDDRARCSGGLCPPLPSVYARLYRSSDNLPQYILTQWRTVLACLVAIAPDRIELLKSLLPEYPGLAIHALLNNPLSPVELLSCLSKVLKSESESTWKQVLAEISLHRPAIAGDLAMLLVDENTAMIYAHDPLFSALRSEQVIENLISQDYRIQLNQTLEDEAALEGQLIAALKVTRKYEALLFAEIAELEHPGMLSFSELSPSSSQFGDQNLAETGDDDNLEDSDALYRSSDALYRSSDALYRSSEDLHRSEVVSNAITRLIDNNPKQAAALLGWYKAIQADPYHPTYRGRYALALAESGRIDDALNWIQTQISDGASDADILIAASIISKMKGLVDESARLAQQAYNLLVNHAEASPFFVNLLAELLFDAGKYSQVIPVAQIGLSRRPNAPGLLAILSRSQLSEELFDEALVNACLAYTLAPENLDYHRQLIRCLETNEHWSLALSERQDYIEAIVAQEAMAPSPEDFRDLAMAALYAGQIEEAAQACHQALMIDPNDGLAYEILGMIAIELGDHNAARDHFHHALLYSPQAVHAWLGIADEYQASRQDSLELETLRAASQANPGSAEIHFRLGQALLRQGAPTQALVPLRRAAFIVSEPLYRLSDEGGHRLSVKAGIDRPSTVPEHRSSEPHNTHTGRKMFQMLKLQVIYTLGKTLYELGLYPEARQLFENICLPSVKGQLMLSSQIGENRGAKTIAQKNALDGDLFTKITYYYARTLVRLDELETAEAWLEFVVQEYPENDIIALDYARTLTRLDAEALTVEAKPGKDLGTASVDRQPTRTQIAVNLLEKIINDDRAAVDEERPYDKERPYARLYRSSDEVSLVEETEIDQEPQKHDSEKLSALELAEASALLAEGLQFLGELEKAQDAYQNALKAGEKQVRLWLGLGQVSLALEQAETALAALQEANQINPDDAVVHRTLSATYEALELPGDAFKEALYTLKLEGENLESLVWFAKKCQDFYFLSSGKMPHVLSSAGEALERACQMAPDRADLLVSLAQVYSLNGDQESTLKILSILASDDRAVYARLHRSSDELYRSDDLDRSDAVYSSSETDLELQVDPDILYSAAKILLKLDTPRVAIQILERAIRLTQANITMQEVSIVELYQNLAQAYLRAGDLSSGLETIEKAIALDSTRQDLYQAQTNFLLALDRLPEASHSIQAASALDPDDPNKFIQLGLIAYQLGNLSDALNYAETAACVARALDAKLSSGEAGINKAMPGRSWTKNVHTPAFIAQSVFAHWLAAEIATVSMQPERALAIFSSYEAGENEASRAALPSNNNMYSSRCTQVELLLQNNDLAKAIPLGVIAMESAPYYPRSLALQARMLVRQENSATASQILKSALAERDGVLNVENHPDMEFISREIIEEYNQETKSQHEAQPTEETYRSSQAASSEDHTATALFVRKTIGYLLVDSELRSLATAAMEFGRWHAALAILDQLYPFAHQQPLVALQKAKTYVKRAFDQRLCQELNIITHAPGKAALDQKSWQAFTESINLADKLIAQAMLGRSTPASSAQSIPDQMDQQQATELEQAQAEIARIRLLGQVVFDPTPETCSALESMLEIHPQSDALYRSDTRLPTTEEIAVGVWSQGKAGNLEKAQRFARITPAPGFTRAAKYAPQAFSKHTFAPLVNLCLALAISDGFYRSSDALYRSSDAQPGDALGLARDGLEQLSRPDNCLVGEDISMAIPRQQSLIASIAIKTMHFIAQAMNCIAQEKSAPEPIPSAELLQTARDAVDSLLTSWPDEPAWHAIAADLVTRSDDGKTRVVVLDQQYPSKSITRNAIYGAMLSIAQNNGIEISISQEALETAQAHLQTAVNFEPDNVDYHLKLAWILLLMNENHGENIVRALHSLETATRLAPDNGDAWLLLAQTQAEFGYYSAGENRDGNTVRTWINKSIISSKKAIECAADPTEALLFRGYLAFQLDDSQTVIRCAQAILSKNPNQPDALYLLSRGLEVANQPVEALMAIKKAIASSDALYRSSDQSTSPAERSNASLGTVDMLLTQARLLQKSQGPQAALSAYQDLASSNPQAPLIFLPLAQCLVALGRVDEATQAARKALHYNQGELSAEEEASLHLLIGENMHKTGQLDQAIHHLTEAKNKDPMLIPAYLELGRAYLDRRQNNLAMEVYAEATKIAPNDYRPYYQAGMALKDNKEYIEAESMLRKATHLSPNDVTIHRQLAAVVALNLVHNRKTTYSSTISSD